MKVVGQSIFKRDKTFVHITSSTARERDLNLKTVSLGITDNAARPEDVITEMAEVLGSEPEYPAASAQWAFLEHETGRTPILLNQASAWHESPTGFLVHVSVHGMRSSVTISFFRTESTVGHVHPH
jgi:hypothetical protein